MTKNIVLSLFLVLAAGCVSDSVQVEQGDQSLSEIKRAIVAVMGDPRGVSENQREFTSQYFSRKPDPKFDPQVSKERIFAKFIILGSRRPYNIEIHAVVEVKTGRNYISTGDDTGVAQRLAQELKAKLNQSRDGRNLIDDFRAF